MKKTKLLPLILSLSLIFTGCSKEDSSDSSSADSSSTQEQGTMFGSNSSGNNSTSADEMRLENFTGSVTLQNQSEEKPVILGSRLVTGDNLETMTESNAYVVLDASKVLRVNETSQVEIIQEDKQLDIHLSKGTVFFNVNSPLTEEESLEFHTNNVITGVRGTSGIIHFDPVNQVTQIVVLTGVVTGTTTSETQSIEAGQIAIVETLPDGSVEMTIYELEEEDPLYYFSDTFVDGMQGDLNNEGQSVPLSDMVRMPEGVNLPTNLQLLGNSRGLSAEQATAYRDYLANSQATHVTFVDSGNNTVVMLAGTLSEYSLSAPDGRPEGGESYIDTTVVSWTGSEIVTTEVLMAQYEYARIKENSDGFFLETVDSYFDTGISLGGYQIFSFNNCLLSQNPERMYVYISSMWEDYAGYYVNSSLNYVLPEEARLPFITQAEVSALADYADSTILATVFELKDGTYEEATTFVEDSTLDFKDVTAPYWNTVEDVLTALS